MAEEAPADKPPTLLQLTVAEVLKPVEHLEEAAEFENIRHHFCLHFERASRKLEWDLSFLQIVDAFSNNAIGLVFNSFASKEWLHEIDLSKPLVVALRQRYPRFSHLSHFDKAVAEACERVLDVKRAQSLIWELAVVARETKMSQGKIYEAVETSRKAAMPLARRAAAAVEPSGDGMQVFMTQWIIGTVNSLKGSTGGHPEKAASSEVLTTLFNSLCDQGGIPKEVTNVFGQPPADWPFLKSTIEEAYGEAPAKWGSGAALTEETLDMELPPTTKRSRTREEGYGKLPPAAETQHTWQCQVRQMQKWSGKLPPKKKGTW